MDYLTPPPVGPTQQTSFGHLLSRRQNLMSEQIFQYVSQNLKSALMNGELD